MKRRIAQVERIKHLVDDNGIGQTEDIIRSNLCTICKSSLVSYLQDSYELVQSHTKSFMLSNNDNNNNNNNNNNNHSVNKREITKETNVLSTKFNDLERNYIKLDHEINRLKILETIIEKGINDELIVQNELERQDNQKEDEQINSLMTAYNTNHEIHSLYNILYCQNTIYNDQYFINGYQLCQQDNNIDWGMLLIIIIA